MGEEQRILQIGGIAGLFAGVLLLLGFIIHFALVVPVAGANNEDFLDRFASFGGAFTTLNGLWLVGVLASLALVLALYKSLKETSPNYALVALLLYLLFVGLSAIFVASTFFVQPRLAALYPMDQATVVQMFEVTHAITNTLAFVGSLLFALSALVLGAIMQRNRDYGWTYGGISLVLGLFAIVLTPLIAGASVGLLLGVVFLLVLGWRVYGLSKASEKG